MEYRTNSLPIKRVLTTGARREHGSLMPDPTRIAPGAAQNATRRCHASVSRPIGCINDCRLFLIEILFIFLFIDTVIIEIE
jgi:hypothetical protein